MNNIRISKNRRWLVLCVVQLILTIQCNHKTNVNYLNQQEKISFYSDINMAKITIYDDSAACIRGATLNSFKSKFPIIVKNVGTIESIQIEIISLVKSDESCNGLFIYRTFFGGNFIPYYVHGTPYYLFALKDNEVIFFEENEDDNLKKMEGLEGIEVYDQILQYKENILNNLILVR